MLSEEQLQRSLDAVDKLNVLCTEDSNSEYVRNIFSTLQNCIPRIGAITIFRRHYTHTTAMTGVCTSDNVVAFRNERNDIDYACYQYDVTFSDYLTVEQIETAYNEYVQRKEQEEHESTAEVKLTVKEYKQLISRIEHLERLCKVNRR